MRHFENGVEPERLQVTKWRVRIASWITKATNTQSDYAIRVAVQLQHW